MTRCSVGFNPHCTACSAGYCLAACSLLFAMQRSRAPRQNRFDCALGTRRAEIRTAHAQQRGDRRTQQRLHDIQPGERLTDRGEEPDHGRSGNCSMQHNERTAVGMPIVQFGRSVSSRINALAGLRIHGTHPPENQPIISNEACWLVEPCQPEAEAIIGILLRAV